MISMKPWPPRIKSRGAQITVRCVLFARYAVRPDSDEPSKVALLRAKRQANPIRSNGSQGRAASDTGEHRINIPAQAALDFRLSANRESFAGPRPATNFERAR